MSPSIFLVPKSPISYTMYLVSISSKNMFSKIINWIKTHKLNTFLIIVVAFLLFGKGVSALLRYSGTGVFYDTLNETAPMSVSGGVARSLVNSKSSVVAPSLSQERKVVTNTSFSLLVKNVNNFIDSAKVKVGEFGGFMVDTQINRDEKAETATIQARIPSAKLEEFSKYIRSISVKVVYENIVGCDITDQYTDYEKRIASLESSKTKLEAIMDKAFTAEDILNIQEKIFLIQNQIDSYKGQLDYMEKASTTSLVTMTVSTDELGLPYYPVKTWRPDIIFKQAVRSLLSILMSVGTFGIWLAVFSPLVILVILIIKLARKGKGKVREIKKS